MEGKAAPIEIRQKSFEDRLGYTALKDSVAQLLEITHAKSKVNGTFAQSVAEDVVSKLLEEETARIFQCLEAARTMGEDLQRHSLHVAFINGLMGQWLKLAQEDIKGLVCAGLLHDIGKIKVPKDILYAPRKLSEEEFRMIKRHTEYSDELLGEDTDKRIRQAVRHHHEKLDGSGYPDGLKENEISLFAKITAISDVYDAMISKRSYKDAVVVFDILESFFNLQFSGLDHELVYLFVKNMRGYYKGEQVLMSDGSEGTVEYIPPNDIRHPIISVDQRMKQADENWRCVSLVYFQEKKKVPQ